MSTNKFNLQQKQEILNKRAKEPSFDEYIFCDACEDFVFEYCSLHGPLLVIPDNEVPEESPNNIPRAALTVPHEFLHFAPSTISGAGIGVFTTLTLPRGVQFGPYRGQDSKKISSMYCWQIYDANRRRKHVVDAADPDCSNWMRYVNCSRHWTEQNLLAYQYQGELYYRTIRTIPRNTELLVFYGTSFAHCLGVDLKHYNTPILPRNVEPQNNWVSDGSETSQKSLVKVKEETESFEPQIHLSEDNVSISQTTSPMEIEKALTTTNFFHEESQSSLNLIEENSSLMPEPVETVICNECTKSFNSKNSLIEHLQIHFPKKIANSELKCEDPMLFRDPLTRLYHCPLCSYQHKKRSYFITRHWLPKHIGKKFPCPICGSEFSSDCGMKLHLKWHGNDRYTCVVCSKNFVRRYSINRHMISVHGEKGILPKKTVIQICHKCEICNKVFQDPYGLKKHINIHVNVNKFKCPTCYKGFRDKHDLKRHINTHFNVNKFKCPTCDKGFRDKYDLKKHINIHLKVHKYTCPTCNKGFSENYKMKRHLESHNRGVTFYCLLCPLIFKSQVKLNLHLETHKVHVPIVN